MTRDRNTIDQELPILAAVGTTSRSLGGKPTSARADQLLDDRLTLTSPPLTEQRYR